MTKEEIIFNKLKELDVNVFQQFPNDEVEFPVIVFSYSDVDSYTHDGIDGYNADLTIDIYTENTQDRSNLRRNVRDKIFELKFFNTNTNDVPNAYMYHTNLRFRKEV